MTLERLFDAGARERIAAAVKVAEARTVGQIVPVVVPRSRDYHGFQRGLGFLALGLGLQLGLASVWPELFALSPAGVLSAIGGWVALCGLPPVRKLFEHGDFYVAVHERALAAFVREGVHETKEGIGVLIFASVYERQVVILGDRAIHAKMGDKGWKEAVELLTRGLASRDAAKGFCAAIEHVGAQLAASFPRTGAPVANELSDELRVEPE